MNGSAIFVICMLYGFLSFFPKTTAGKETFDGVVSIGSLAIINLKLEGLTSFCFSLGKEEFVLIKILFQVSIIPVVYIHKNSSTLLDERWMQKNNPSMMHIFNYSTKLPEHSRIPHMP